jgi:2-pyrone-4,6-dicarboxylate lactonase
VPGEFAHTLPMRPAETNTKPRFPMTPVTRTSLCSSPGFPHVPEPLYTFPDGALEQYLRVTESLDIERMVLVQPTYYGTDNSLLIETLGKVGPRCRGGVRIEGDTSEDEPCSDSY